MSLGEFGGYWLGAGALGEIPSTVADSSITQGANISSSAATVAIVADSAITQGSHTTSSAVAVSIVADSSAAQDANTSSGAAAVTITADQSSVQDNNTSTGSLWAGIALRHATTTVAAHGSGGSLVRHSNPSSVVAH